jgi:hypothetical protein
MKWGKWGATTRIFIRDGVTLRLLEFLGNRALRTAFALSIIVSMWAFKWASTIVEDPRVGLFCHFSIRSDFSVPVHFVVL